MKEVIVMKVRLRKLLTFILAVALAIPSGFAIQEGGEVKHAKAAEQYKWYCKECGKKFVERPSNHTVSKLAGYRCDSCGQLLSSSGSHNKNEVWYRCESCGAESSDYSRLTSAHNGEITVYQCYNCGQAFTSKQSHNREVLDSNSSGDYYCSSCNHYYDIGGSHKISYNSKSIDPDKKSYIIRSVCQDCYEEFSGCQTSHFATYCQNCGKYDNNTDNWALKSSDILVHKVCKAMYPVIEINTEHSDFIYSYEVPCDGSASLKYIVEPCSASDWRTHTEVRSHTGNVIDYIKSVKCDGSTVAEYKDTTCNGTIAPITAKVTFDPVLSGLSSTTKNVQVYTDITSTLNSVSYEDTTGKYTFLGWNTDKNATSALTSLQISQDTTLYAIWKLNRHKIKFNTGFSDITQADRTLDFGSSYGELPNLVKTGYTFRGWYNGNTPVSSSTKMGDSDVTLTAKWDRKTYKLSYNVNGGKESYTTKDILYLDKLGTLPTPTRTGYTFKGWYNGSTKVSEDTQMPAENVELNASWQIGKYTLSYVTGFDNLTQNDKVLDYDTAYGSLPELSEEGYTFLGWYTQADGGTKVTADDKISDANVKIYAHWKINQYTLSYDTNTTESVYGATKVDFKSSNTLPVPTKKGYTFLGWYDGSTLIGSVSGGKYTPKDYVMPAKDVTLIGKWSINSYKLKYNTGFDDITLNDKTLDYNTQYGELPVLTRDGYTFHGWKNSNKETVNADTVIFDSDVQLTADWSINSYKVTFNSNGGKESYDEKTVKYLETLGVLPVPTKVGHTFEGWFNGDEKVSEDTVMSFKDINLVAKWSVNKYTLSFDTGFDELKENSKLVAYDTAFGELPVLTREGYTFNGWVDSEGAKVSDTNKMPASDVKLTAVWTINQYKVSLDTNSSKTITKDTIEVVKVKKTKKAYKFTVKTKKKSGKFMIQFGKKKNKLKKKYYVKSNNKAYKKIKKGKYKSKVYKGIKVSKYKNGKYVVTIKKSVLNGGKYIKFSKYTIKKKKLKVLLKGTTKKFK